jgi:phosphoenolpyruvate carboxylase
MHELRAGPSEQQRAAIAATQLQLQRDLEAQMAEKAARAEAQAAAEAARAAAEDAAVQQYLLAKTSSQADVSLVGKEASMVYAAAGLLNAPAAAPVAATKGSGAHGPVRKGRCKTVIDAP